LRVFTGFQPGSRSTGSFNQFLIADERPALIHTGMRDLHGPIRNAIREVLDPAKLAYVVLLHREGDENGGMDQFMKEARKSELIGSILSIQLNAIGFGLAERARGFRDGEMLDLGTHKLRFLETPHVHHWDSMMVLDETSRSLFPSDLFIQPADQPPVVTENLSMPMLDLYRGWNFRARTTDSPGCRSAGEDESLVGPTRCMEARLSKAPFRIMRERCVKTNLRIAGCYWGAKSRKSRRCKALPQ
jgi:flavorubredoxin